MPNAIIDQWRVDHPEDERSDWLLTLALGHEQPALLQDEQFKSEFDQINSPLDSAIKGSLTAGDYVQQAVGSVERGLGRMVSSVPKSLAIGASWLDENVVDLSLGGNTPQEKGLFKLGTYGEALTEKIAPEQIEALKDSWIATKIPQGIGSALGFLVGGVAGAGAKIPAWASTATLGSMSTLTGSYEDAKAHGASEEAAMQAGLAATPFGLSEAFPMARWINRLNKGTGGTFTKTLLNSGKETVEEALQEAFQQTGQNIVAQNIYDKDREMFEGLQESAAVGGATGFLFSLLTSAIGRARGSSGDVGSTSTRAAQPDSAGAPNAPVPSAEPLPTRSEGMDVVKNAILNPRDMAPQDRQFVEQVIARELAGDTSVEVQTARQAIANNPVMSTYYAIEQPVRMAEFLQRPREGVQSSEAIPQEVQGQGQNVLTPAAGPVAAVAEPTVAPVLPIPLPVGPTANPQPAGAGVVVQPAVPGELAAAQQRAALARESELARRREVLRQAAVNFEGANVPRETLSLGQAETIEQQQARLGAEVAAKADRDVQLAKETQLATAKRTMLERAAAPLGGDLGSAGQGGLFAEPGQQEIFQPPASSAAQQRADANEFTKLVTEYGEQLGWILKPDLIHGRTDTRTGASGAAVKAKVAGDKELAFAKRRAITELGGDTANTKPADISALLPKLKARIAEYEAAQAEQAAEVGIEGDLPYGSEPVDFLPGDALVKFRPATEVAVKPKWSLPELIANLAFETAAVVGQTPGGKGTKTAPVFVENPTVAELLDDSRAKGGNKAVSRKLAVLLTPDGQSVLIGTAYANPEPYVAAKEGTERPGQSLDSLLKAGYKLIGALKTAAPTQGFTKTYSTPLWFVAVADIKSQQSGARNTAAAMEAKLAEAGYDREQEQFDDIDETLEGLADELGDAAVETPTEARIVFTRAVADEIVDTIDSLADGGQRTVDDALVQEALEEIFSAKGPPAEAIGRVLLELRKSGYEYQEATQAVRQNILHAFQNSGGGERFSKILAGEEALRSAAGGAGDQQGDNSAGQAGILRNRQATETDPRRATGVQINSAFFGVVDGLRAAGVEVRLIREQAEAMVQEWGTYTQASNGQQVVTLSLADAHNPSRENLTYLLHEAGHAVFARESPERQAQLRNAIGRASDKGLTVEGFVPQLDPRIQGEQRAGVVQEERLVESIARELAVEGFNPAESRSIGQRIVRLFKYAILRAALAVQRFLGIRPSVAVARAYFRVRVEQMLSTAPISVTAWIGGPQLTLAEQSETFRRLKGDDLVGEIYEWETGTIRVSPALVNSVGAARFNEEVLRHRRPQTVRAPAEISPDLDSTAQKAVEVAYVNEYFGTLRKMFDHWNLLNLNTAKLSFEQWLESGSFVKFTEHADAQIAAINEALARDGQPPVPVDRKITDLPAEAQKEASLSARRLQWGQREWLSNKRTEAEVANPRLAKRLSRSNVRLQEMLANYTSADFVLSNARERVEAMIKEATADAKKAVSFARQAGTLSQVVRQLEGRMDRPAEAQFRTALERLYKKFSGDEGGRKFFDILQRVAELNVDWQATKVVDARAEIRFAAENDNLLAPLVTQELEGRALMSIVIAYAKRNQTVMDLLQLRRSEAIEERAAVNALLQQAMSDRTDAMNEARKAARKLPRLGALADRLLRQLDEEKARNREMLDQIQRNKAFIDFHQETLPVLQSEMARLEEMTGTVDTTWEATHLAKYMVPSGPNASLDSVAASTKEFRLSAGTVGADVKADIRKMTAWLDAQKNHGAIWQTVKTQRDKLSLLDKSFLHTPLRATVGNRLLGSITDKLDLIGHPATKEAARRLRQVVSLTSFDKQAAADGTKWSVLEGAAQKALGIKDKETFRNVFTRRGLDFISSRSDIFAANAEDVANGLVLKELRRYLEADPDTRGLLAKPGAWAALEKFYRAYGANAASLKQIHKAFGLKVEEEGKGGYRILRDLVGASLARIPRGFSGESKRIYQVMRSLGWLEAAPDVAAAYDADPTALRQALTQRFPPEVWKHFVGELVNMPGRSLFNSPMGADGLYQLAMRGRVLKAFEATAPGDVVGFAENLYALEGGTTEMGAFVGETMDTLQNYFGLLHGAHQETAYATEQGAPLPKNALLDARQTDEMPPRWLDYSVLDSHGMATIVKSLAFETAMGRDMLGIRSNFDTAEKALAAQALEWKDVKEKVALTGVSGRAERAALRAEAERRGGAGYLTVLENAERNGQTVRGMRGQFDALLKGVFSDQPIEMRPFLKLVQMVAALTVQGPGTALVDTVSLIEQPLRKYGLNTTGLKAGVYNVQGSVVSAVNGLFQAFGTKVRLDAEHTERQWDLGMVDTDATLTLKQKMAAAAGEDTYAKPGFGSGVARMARVAQVVLGTGIGRAQPGAPPVPTTKPHAVFTQWAQNQHAGVVSGTWKLFDNIMGRALDYFKANPAALADVNFKFKPADLGYGKGFFGFMSNERAFEALRVGLLENGMELETLAREAHARRRVDPKAPFFTADQYRLLGVQGVSETMLEANLTTRMPSLLTNPWAAAASPLVGWSISKSNAVLGGFREPGGELSMKSFGAGMLAYTALIPLGLAFAWLREEYDEELLGKKSNVQGYGENNTTLAALEKLGRMGTFGVAGDLANSIFNMDTNRPFTVDNRVLFVSSTISGMNALHTLYKQGGVMTYSTVYRPMLSALGGSGYLQYADILNNAMSLDNAEARVTARINVGNLLRAAGRELELDVRTGRGMASLPTPIKPWISQMTLAAYANDAADFKEAWENAKREAMETRGVSREEAAKYVAQSFGAYHPLRAVFKTTPTEAQYARLLGAMSDDGKVAVSSATHLFNKYAEQIGGRAFTGRQERTAQLIPRFTQPATLTDFRRAATAYGSAF